MAEEDECLDAVEEMSISKLQYHLAEYPKLLAKALVAEKGQKALIKKLYCDQYDLIEKCSVNDLRSAVCEESFLAIPEGRKLAVLFISKIGSKQFWILAKNVIQKTKTNRKMCEFYGEIFLSYWKMAKTDEERRSVELAFEDIVHYAICAKSPINEHFQQVLEPLIKGRNKQMDGMIERILRPNLWRSLQSPNDLARFNSCKLFFSFYPIIKNDDLENAEFISVQLASMADLITDSSIPIRAYSYVCFKINFMGMYPCFLLQIITKLSKDSSSEVRLSVYDGLQHMVRCAEAVNTVESSVRSLILKGINDNVVKQVLERFEIEKADSVKKKVLQFFSSVKKIAELLIKRIFTPNASADEILKRVTYMGNINRVAVVKFHECICRYRLISLDQAADHIIAMGTTVYKLTRSFEQSSDHSLATFDLTDITQSSIENVAPIIVDAAEDDNREGARIWRQLCFLIESLSVSYAILREPLSAEQYASKRAKVSRLLTKLFSYLLHCFKESSLAETVLIFGSTLRVGSELVQISNVLCKELCYAPNINPTLVAGYIEALANWNLEKIIDIVGRGICSMKNELKSWKQNQKRSKSTSLVDNTRDLEFVKDVISLKLSCNSIDCDSTSLFTTSNVVRALEIRKTLALILVNISAGDDKQKLLSEIHLDLKWFIELLPNLVTVEDKVTLDFLLSVSQAVLRLLSTHLESYAYEEKFLIDVASVVLMLCNQKAPHIFNGAQRLLSEFVYGPINTCLIWISSRCFDEGFDAKGCSDSFLDLLNTVQGYNNIANELLTELSRTFISIMVGALNDRIRKSQVADDPRGSNFETNVAIELLIHRILVRDRVFLRALLNTFRDIVQSGLLTQDLDDDDMIYMCGAELQFLHLCVEGTRGTTCDLSVSNERCTNQIAERKDLSQLVIFCFDCIENNLRNGSEALRSHCMYEELLLLCKNSFERQPS
uniref:Condensin complex subunit 1 n=1 Tax=Syphacia muris TaxID=451379 RepID=A0A0N5AW07_9BILA